MTGVLKFFRNADEDRERAKVTVTHVISSLSVRADEGYKIDLEAWSYFAAELGQYIELTACSAIPSFFRQSRRFD